MFRRLLCLALAAFLLGNTSCYERPKSQGAIATGATLTPAQRHEQELMERCDKELQSLDAKSCYRWALQPPVWAELHGKVQPGQADPALFHRAMTLAIARDPQFMPAYLARGQFNDALADLNKAIELAPDFAAGYMARGDYYLHHDEPQRAEEDFSKLIALLEKKSPEFRAVHGIYYQQSPAENLIHAIHLRAVARLLQGREDQAINDLEEAARRLEAAPPQIKQRIELPMEWFLEFAWISATYDNDKARNLVRAKKLVERAARLDKKEKDGFIPHWDQFDIINAAIAAESGDFSKAVNLEEKVKYGEIQWGNPEGEHQRRLQTYQGRKPIRTKEFWFLLPSRPRLSPAFVPILNFWF
jgi:tetratricopeptide (TPR) repeat protein